MSQAKAARALGVSRTTLRGWERGAVVPPWQAVRQMATLYAVPVASTAAAAGVAAATLDPARWTSGDLARVLSALRRWRGLTQAQVALSCGTSIDSVRAWEHGRQQPGPESRHRLETLYDLPESTLLQAYNHPPSRVQDAC
jgi:DNA-binding transcriptional regulator YiaG